MPTTLLALLLAATPAPRSPRNQVYQFAAQGPGNLTGYLWIPETCARLRGLLVFAQNVPETLIAGHPAVRAACAANHLGIFFSSPSFWPGKLEHFGQPGLKLPEGTRKLDALLAQLAEKSGYPEVATVPWLPIGESMSLLMVRGLVNERPERCIAAIFACDIDHGTDRTVPLLGAQGTASEWGQTRVDLRSAWRQTGRYASLCEARRQSPRWPVSLLVDAGGGHFTCSEPMLRYFGLYIDRAAKARLSADGSPALKPVDYDSGCLARLPLPGAEPVDPARGATDTGRPWFFDRECAEQAQALAQVDWAAETQVPLVRAGEHCTVTPWSRNSVTTIDVRTSGEFSLRPFLLDKLPAGFVGAGAPLATTRVSPVVEWVSGSLAPLNDNRFCVELDRNARRATLCLAVVAERGTTVRRSVQPLLVNLAENTQGTPQTIDFAPLADVPAGTASVPLVARASSGLPVKFYVDAGPAVVDGGQLRFTAIPPSARYPVEVSVVAWQWGTCEPPLFSRAQVRQTLRLVK